MTGELMLGLGAIALVGGGFRAAVLFWALSRSEANHPGRTRLLAWCITAVSVAGAAMVGLALSY